MKKILTFFKEKTLLVILITLLLFCFGSCKKDTNKEFDNPKKVLSKNDTDYVIRLAAIKKKFYEEKLDEKLIPNMDKRLTWIPDWDHPKALTINDSTSYVFYKLIGKVEIAGKEHTATEKGGASYLMIKNEKDFYKAFYFLPEEQKSIENNFSLLNMSNYSGRLLLSNLQGGKNYMLEYANGRINEAYQKKTLIQLNKIASASNTTSYWERQCQYEMSNCTYVSSGSVNCGQFYGIEVVYSPSCNSPSPICGVQYWLSDYDVVDVCEYVWFPDPPVDPGYGGTGYGDDFEPTASDLDNATLVDADTSKKIKNISKYIDCFDDAKAASSYTMTIYIDQPVANNNAHWVVQPPNYQFDPSSDGVAVKIGNLNLDVGHAFVCFEKNNIDGTNVRQTVGFYPGSSPLNSKGIIKDDSGHSYDVSFTRTVTALQFDAALSSLASHFAYSYYDLRTYNCTDAAISIMNYGGANFSSIPRGAFNNTPGDFGQFLRSKPSANKNGGNGVSGKGPCN